MTKKKKKDKKKKAQKNERDKFLLETSIQIDKFNLGDTASKLNSLSSNSRFYTSHFVLYEFKTSIIRSLIQFYSLVKLYESPPEAIAAWSQRFSVRDLKYKIILESLMGRIFKSIDFSDKKLYLEQIESIIFFLLADFKNKIEASVGDFSRNEIVRFPIDTSSDFKAFTDLYRAKQTITLDVFWSENEEHLESLLGDKSGYNKSGTLKKLLSSLEEVRKDFKNSNKRNINTVIRDAVIAVDCPNSLILASLDKSFEIISPKLNKKFHIFERTLGKDRV